MPDLASRFAIGSIDAAADESSGRRVVTFTPEETKLIDRVGKLLHSKGDKFSITCGQPGCPESTVTFERTKEAAGGAILVCGCTRRRLVRSFGQ